MALRRLSGLSAAAAIAIASLGFALPGAHAATGGIKVSNTDAGKPMAISVSGCSTAGVNAGATVDILPAGSSTPVATVNLGRKTSGTVTVTEPGAYVARVTCMSYNADGSTFQDWTTETYVTVWSTQLQITPDTWARGESVNLSAQGFAPGESISLTMIDYTTRKVIFTRTVGKADADGNFSYDIVLPHDVPDGTYVLAAKGETSGKVRVTGFYWGAPDDANDGSDTEDDGDNTVVNNPKPVTLPATGN